MDKKFIGLISLFFLTFGVFSATVLFNKPLTQLIRAKEDIAPSTANSLIFAWPLTVNADGKSTSSVTVFVRTTTDKPIANKQVSIASTLGSFKNNIETTDNGGKATFTLTSDTKGIADIEAAIDNDKIQQKVSVKFE